MPCRFAAQWLTSRLTASDGFAFQCGPPAAGHHANSNGVVAKNSSGPTLRSHGASPGIFLFPFDTMERLFYLLSGEFLAYGFSERIGYATHHRALKSCARSEIELSAGGSPERCA